MIQPIETVWRGFRFRSRLEARWAVFFDRIGAKWQHEPEAYNLGASGCYLPDFIVTGLNRTFFVEVKPESFESTRRDEAKWEELALRSDHRVLLALGAPSAGSHWVCYPDIDHNGYERVLWLPHAFVDHQGAVGLYETGDPMMIADPGHMTALAVSAARGERFDSRRWR